ncbi:MAG: helix-turn-helix domain-containing protein [Planctomycetes bacterium]|nr:helix-turn-helix domain-containing protein [Planctomycetota bacterium]
MADNNVPQMTDLNELAAAAQVSRRTLERLVAQGRIRAVRVGRLVRISPSERARFLEEGALPAGSLSLAPSNPR